MQKVAQKDTGNYNLVLVDHDDEFVMQIRYTGEWASGEWVEISLPDADKWVNDRVNTGSASEVRRLGKEWLDRFVRGDLDVVDLLEKQGFDKFTNHRRGRR